MAFSQHIKHFGFLCLAAPIFSVKFANTVGSVSSGPWLPEMHKQLYGLTGLSPLVTHLSGNIVYLFAIAAILVSLVTNGPERKRQSDFALPGIVAFLSILVFSGFIVKSWLFQGFDFIKMIFTRYEGIEPYGKQVSQYLIALSGLSMLLLLAALLLRKYSARRQIFDLLISSFILFGALTSLQDPIRVGGFPWAVSTLLGGAIIYFSGSILGLISEHQKNAHQGTTKTRE